MVAFNQSVPQDTGVQNMTGRSQGQIPDKSFAALFEGITETAGNVIQIKDEQNQKDIETEANQIFDSTNEEFGVAPPPGMQDGMDRMATLQAAFEQGKIN